MRIRRTSCSDHDALQDQAKYGSRSRELSLHPRCGLVRSPHLCSLFTVPTEFTSVPFPVKAFKLLLHDLQSGGEAASMGFSAKDVSEVDSDDGVRPSSLPVFTLTLLLLACSLPPRSRRSLSFPVLRHTMPCFRRTRLPNHTSHPSFRGSLVLAHLLPSSLSPSSFHFSLPSCLRCMHPSMMTVPATYSRRLRDTHDRTRSGPRRRRSTRASRRTSSRSCRTCSARAGWRSTTTTRSRATTTRTSRTTPSLLWTCRYVVALFLSLSLSLGFRSVLLGIGMREARCGVLTPRTLS